MGSGAKGVFSSEEVAERNRKRVWTPEMRAKVAASVVAYAAEHPDSKETREKKGAKYRGSNLTSEHSKNISKGKTGLPRPDMKTGGKNSHNRFTGPWTDEMRAAKSVAMSGRIPPGYKRFWENATEEERNNAIRLRMVNAGMHPNKAEISLQEILDITYPDCYQYVGDGSLIIGGKCPDFIYGNKLIELFGDYWHRGEDPLLRIAHFRKYGFQTLVIWERELKDPDLIDRVIAFTGVILTP